MEHSTSSSARLRGARLRGGIGIACTIATAAACRIYRQPPSHDDGASAGAAKEAATSGHDGPSGEREATKPSAPAADALNLWVLSRPKGDLPSAAEPTPPAAMPPDVRGPIISVGVVLGVGPGQGCPEHFARQAADALSADRRALDVLSSLLDSARRWRWPDPARSLSATLTSSKGAFGGVQSAPPSAVSAPLLRHALERHAILGGHRFHWPAASEPAPDFAPCPAGVGPGLAGPIGVLLRNREGDFYAGVLHADPLADAGVVSISAQYGVSLAVGEAGAVLMVADCEPPPLDGVAERIYASANWVVATTELQTPSGCRVGHALFRAERAWLAPPGVLAGAIVEVAPPPSVRPPPPPPPAPASSLPAHAPDAGAAAPSVSP